MSAADSKASLERIELLASALHAQLLARRRATLDHDIKNVMHGLLSGTELLAKSLGTSSARISPNECLALLQQQLGRAQTTLDRMLDEVAPPDIDPVETELAELVTECTHALRHQLQPLSLKNAVERGPKVRVHLSRCKDALMAILLGCIDRSPARSNVELTASIAADRVTLRIRHVLQDPASVIGMSELQELLASDSVHLDVSAAGTQRTIEVAFPLVVADIEPRASGAVLVIVDGNRDAADSLAMLTQLEGFDASASYDVDGAIAAVKSRQPVAVVLDLDGSIDGGVLLRKVRAENPRVRLIGLGYSHTNRSVEADAYLGKPLDISALRKALEGAA